jgi:hypothetical protein
VNKKFMAMTQRYLFPLLFLLPIGLYPTAAHAENWVDQGISSTDETVVLDFDSVRAPRTSANFDFTYRIGPDLVMANINCATQKIWPEGYPAFIPNSGSATARMAERVCQIGKQLQQTTQSVPATSGLPLQVGIYRTGSRYIQIANQGERLCYHGFTARGATTASLTPDPNRPGFYKIYGWNDTVLKQETNHSILFGSEHRLNSIEADNSFPAEIGDVLQACLDSRSNFNQAKTSFR